MIYENTRNLVSIAKPQHNHTKNLNINSVTTPVLKADTGASTAFLKEEDITKLVHVQKLPNGPIAILQNSVPTKATHKGLLPLHD